MKIKIVIILFAVFSAGAAVLSTSADYSSRTILNDNSFASGSAAENDIVINEFMANPDGDDDAAMPGGEWVELYNKGGWPIDLATWHLSDSSASNVLDITVANTQSGSTVIPGNGYLVVYRNGDSDFILNNASADAVILYNPSDSVIDQYLYASGTIYSGKTWARIPNGIGIWLSNRTPTLGGPNV